MTTIQIPMIDTARQSLVVTLGGQEVKLTVWWQPSDGHWYGTLEVPPGVPVVKGRRLVLDAPMVDSPSVGFRGEIYLRRLLDSDAEPGNEAWDSTHALTYEG